VGAGWIVVVVVEVSVVVVDVVVWVVEVEVTMLVTSVWTVNVAGTSFGQLCIRSRGNLRKSYK
jgi:hypothetical protein